MLSQQRKQIDQIDREIVALFEKRTKLTEEVAAIKLKNGLDILDSGREEAIIDKVTGYLKDPTLADELTDLYTQLMRISRDHQQKWMKSENNK